MTPRTMLSLVIVAALALGVGVWLGRRTAQTASDDGVATRASESPCPDGRAPRHWRAPMDATYVRDAPGKSPMGMDLVPVCEDTGDGTMLEIDTSARQLAGVRTIDVARTDLTRTIRAVGRVSVDERRIAHVHTKVQGWVERLFVDSEGVPVERGQPLLELYSPELVATQEELLLADRYRASTESSPFEEVRESGRSLLEASRRRLELWDVPTREIDRLLETGEIRRTLTLDAQTSGVVTELAVRAGMEVEPNQNLYTITDLAQVWVVADVYEFELPWLAVGQTARVELESLPGRVFEGRVGYIAPFLDPKTRTAEIRIELANDQALLKPEMFGRVLIDAAQREDALAVPSTAVLRSGRRSLVFVETGTGRFEARPVRLGVEAGDGLVEIVTGLEVGESVVVSGQFLIDSESRLEEAIRKLETAESGSPEHDAHDHGAAHETGDEPREAHEPADDPHAHHRMPAADGGD